MDTSQLWSWALTVVGVTGFWLAGRKVWWCWYVNIGCQVLWYAYAFVTEQWGFVVAATIYTFVFTKNAVSWTKEHRERAAAIARATSVAGCTCSRDADRTYVDTDPDCPLHGENWRESDWRDHGIADY